MYRKDDKEEILAAVQQLGVRLDALEALLRKSDAKAEPDEEPRAEASVDEAPPQSARLSGEKTLLWDMTQTQYELSKELSDGVARLKKMIAQGQSSAVKAKGQYQK